MLREATERVDGPHPFEPHGTGWTLVTFTVPEGQRTLRHRLRSTLTWEGFAPLRDGLWLAPGEVDLAAALEPLARDCPPRRITAFHARELPGFAMGESVRAAWDIDTIRDEHLAFIDSGVIRASAAEAGTPRSRPARCSSRTGSRCCARTPACRASIMGEDWPADRSYALYCAVRDDDSRPTPRREFAAHRGELGSVTPPNRARRSAFRTFPDAVRGSSSTTTTFFGIL